MDAFLQARTVVFPSVVLLVISCVNSHAAEFTWEHGPLHLAAAGPRQPLSLGVMKPSVRHVFRISVVNSGSATLHLLSVTSSCGCSSLRFKSGTILPGASTELVFEVMTPHNVGNTSFVVRVKSSESGPAEQVADEALGGMAVHVDEFRFHGYVRDECTVLPSRPILRPTVDSQAAPYRMRIVNYSDATWLEPSVQFSDIDVPFTVREDRLVIDEQGRQVLHITIDRHELSKRLVGVHPWPETINLKFFARKGNGPNGQMVVTDHELAIVRERVAEVHPKRMHWADSSSSRATLVLVSRSKQSITPDDIVVRAYNSRSPLDVEVEATTSHWLKIHVSLPFRDDTGLLEDVPQSVTVEVPKLHFSQDILIVRSH